MKLTALALLFSTGLVSSEATDASHASPDPVVVARAYMAASLEPGAAELELVTEDFAFIDRPGELFGGVVSAGVQGREIFGRLKASWNILSSEWTETACIAAGNHVVLVGKIAWTSAGMARTPDVDFCVALTIRGDKVAARRDFGDWDVVAAPNPESEAALEEKARVYFEAYLAGELGEVEAFLAPDASFADPTAADGRPTEIRGADIVPFLEEEATEPREFDERLAFFTGRHALFFGERTTEVDGASITVPVVTQLEFDGDHLAEHRRYVARAKEQTPGADGE